MKVKSLSRIRPFATPWTAAYQAPPSMGFSRQEYWSGVSSQSPKVLWVIVYYTHITCVSQAASQGVNHTDFLWVQQMGVKQKLWTSRCVPLWQP